MDAKGVQVTMPATTTSSSATALTSDSAPAQRSPADTSLPAAQRYLPLDAYRGLIMLLLTSGGFGFTELAGKPIYKLIADQFEHRPWGGAVFYDMIMPAFLFMVGVAMPFAFSRRTQQGATPRDNFRQTLARCLRLVVISEILVSIQEGRAHLSVHNVLTVVAITYFVCFLLMRLDFWKQAAVAAGLLVLHSGIYLLFPGPDGAFMQVTNAGARFDRWSGLASANLPWECVTINLICEIPSVLFGVWVGNLLRSSRPRAQQMKILLLGMAASFALGLAFSPLVPINKWLWTATYALYTTGSSILGLMILYLLIDIFGIRRPMFFLTVVGRNSLFVYCVGGLLGGWIYRSLTIFTGGFKFVGALAPVAQSCAGLLVIWLMAYWLYRHKVFISA